MMQRLFHILLFLAAATGIAKENSLVSFYAVDSKTKEVLFDEQGSQPLVPASCMKIITTAAALHLLGPETRFKTHLEYEGTLDAEGTLHGNILIRGGGDPCLGSDRISPCLSWEEQIAAWGAAIKGLGILRIAGKIIGDASTWEKAMAVPSWNWEDIGNYYGAGA